MCNIEKKRLIKEVNRSLSKAMYIYLKLLLRRSQNFDFLGLKNSLPGQFFGELQLTQMSLNFKLCGFFIILILKGIMTI